MNFTCSSQSSPPLTTFSPSSSLTNFHAFHWDRSSLCVLKTDVPKISPTPTEVASGVLTRKLSFLDDISVWGPGRPGYERWLSHLVAAGKTQSKLLHFSKPQLPPWRVRIWSAIVGLLGGLKVGMYCFCQEQCPAQRWDHTVYNDLQLAIPAQISFVHISLDTLIL